MMYELWDMRSKNMIAYWDSAREADQELSALARKHGLSVLNGFCLVHEDEREESHLVAEDEAILVAIKRLSTAEAAEISSSPPTRRRVG